MGDLSPNLSRYEMACECGCGFDTVDIELVVVLQGLCDFLFGDMGWKPVLIITGPNRCRMHNSKTPGASPNSQHVYARAADFKIKVHGEFVDPKRIYNYLHALYPNQYGIGLYNNRVHIDTRTGPPARWEG